MKVMARHSPLDDAEVGMTEVGNMDEAVVAAELERVFRENPTASDGERRPASPDDEDILSESGSGNENSRTYYFRSSTITVGKIKEMAEKVTFQKTELAHQGPKLCRSQITTKLWCMRTFSLLACACLCIRSWLIFCYTSSTTTSVVAQCYHTIVKIYLGGRQLRGSAFGECVHEMV
jgi:hypothetical protein